MTKKTVNFEDTEYIKMVADRVDDILEAVDDLTKMHVYVGVPESHDSRGENIGNAALAYIHNYGSYRAHIPARPFLEPGIEKSQDTINKEFTAAAKAALDGDKRKTLNHLQMAAFAAVGEIKATIQAGIPPPLKARSVILRHKTRHTEISYSEEYVYPRLVKEGASAQTLMQTATPLINTGKLLQSITFVITHD